MGRSLWHSSGHTAQKTRNLTLDTVNASEDELVGFFERHDQALVSVSLMIVRIYPVGNWSDVLRWLRDNEDVEIQSLQRFELIDCEGSHDSIFVDQYLKRMTNENPLDVLQEKEDEE